jgi:hypothetical protein
MDAGAVLRFAHADEARAVSSTDDYTPQWLHARRNPHLSKGGSPALAQVATACRESPQKVRCCLKSSNPKRLASRGLRHVFYRSCKNDLREREGSR